MKVLKKPKFKKITCPVCVCTFLPSEKDILTNNGNMVEPDHIFAKCPVCRRVCQVEPKKKTEPVEQKLEEVQV